LVKVRGLHDALIANLLGHDRAHGFSSQPSRLPIN
jgi:hypothetical protein